MSRRELTAGSVLAILASVGLAEACGGRGGGDPRLPHGGIGAPKSSTDLPRIVIVPGVDYFDLTSTTRARLSAAAVDDDASHAFFGTEVSGAHRARAVAVIRREGVGFSRTARYLPLADHDLDPDASVVVTDLAVHGHVLYALWNDRASAKLSTYDLSADGAPVRTSLRVIELGPTASGKLLFSHVFPVVYATLESSTVVTLAVDDKGHATLPKGPDEVPVDLGTIGLSSVALSEDGRTLYAGGRPDALLEVALSNTGRPVRAQSRAPHQGATWPCAENGGDDEKENCKTARYAFVATRSNLYRTYGGKLALRGRMKIERLGIGAASGEAAARLDASTYAMAFDPSPRLGAP